MKSVNVRIRNVKSRIHRPFTLKGSRIGRKLTNRYELARLRDFIMEEMYTSRIHRLRRY